MQLLKVVEPLQEVAGQNETDYESSGSESGRSEGDPIESQKTRVDHDEDLSNPMYIPKRGTFYEHDDRTAANGEEVLVASTELAASEKKEGSETAGGDRRRPPRKSEANNKWAHDKYIEKEQVPKSREELVAIYGYDIRNEDAPPHARRNRRYGRGPNKYTRNWEDKEAYKRQVAAQLQQRKPPTSEDFPELDASKKQIRRRVPRPRSKSQPSSNDSIDSSSLRRNHSMKKPSPRQGGNRERGGKRDNSPGPNKYTRNWEDEEAYKRQVAAQLQQRKPPTSEDFPELDASKKQIRRRVPRPRSKSQPSSNDSIDSSSLRRNHSMKKPSPRQGYNREWGGKRDNSRGPNKYTRNWEDEEAYKRQVAAQLQQRKPPTSEDFPELDASKNQIRRRVPRPRSKSQPSSNDSIDSSSLRRNHSMKKPSPRQGGNRERGGMRDNSRGPNKYTRNWEDEEAYKRQVAAQLQQRKPPTSEDFAELDASKNQIRRRVPRPRSKSQPSSNDSIDSSSLRRNHSMKKPSPRQGGNCERGGKRDNRDIRDNRENRDNRVNRDNRENKDIRDNRENRENRDSRDSRENRESREFRGTREIKKNKEEPKLPPIENLTITASALGNNQAVRKVNTNVAQQRPVPTQQAKKPPQSQPLTKQPPPKVNQQPQQQTQPKQPSEQQAPETRASKRYSSLRQRPLDTYQQVEQHGYNADYPQNSNQAHGNSQQLLQKVQHIHRSAANQSHGPSPPQQQVPQQQMQQQQITQQQLQQVQQQQLQQQQLQQQQIAQQQIQQQQLQQQQLQQQQIPQQQMLQPQIQQQQARLMEQQLVSHPHHTVHNLPQQHAIGQMQQAYAPPAMMPAQYMQPQVTAIFTPAPVYVPPAPYAAHPQMYTQHHNYAKQAGGLTYYRGLPVEPETPRAQRRPTAAIPIVRPENRPASSTEKDNIDRIVENMFVRKPWPGPGNPDAPKDKERSQEPRSKEASQPNISIDSSTQKPAENNGEIEPNTKVDKTEVVAEPSPVVEETTKVPEESKTVKIEEKDLDANSVEA